MADEQPQSSGHTLPACRDLQGGYYTLKGEKELSGRFWERFLAKDHWDRDREA